jgi:RNA polymerase sigma-70 factor (ECF subfamily)
MTSDWDCLQNARDGDEASWQQLVSRHHSRLVTMTFLITGSMAAAKDIAQETFVRLFRRAPKHTSGSFSSYMSTIAYRLALKERKRGHRNRDIEHITLPDGDPGPLDRILKKERDQHIWAIIQSLEEHHRNILVLRFYGAHSYNDIATITNIPVGTVKSRIFHAVKACRTGLREKGIIE